MRDVVVIDTSLTQKNLPFSYASNSLTMGDPLSIAGSAAGIISIALTACQGIFTYYESYHTQSQDVCDAMQKLQLLVHSLSILQDCIPKISASQEAITHVERCISFCRDATSRLECFVQKYRQHPSPATMKEKLHICEQKILFPFRKSTLKNLSATICDFQDSLNTALLIAQLYVFLL